jgi:CHAD domain-containing protein
MQLSPLTKYLTYQLYHAILMARKIGPDAEIIHLHQFRVALRRIRSLLKLYTPDSLSFPSELKAFLKATNPLREFDIFLLSLDPNTHKQVLKPLQSIRYQQYETVVNEIFTYQLFELLHTFYDSIIESNPSIDEDQCEQMTKEHYRQSLKNHYALSLNSTEKEIHRVRIQFKISRYALEFLNEAFLKNEAKKIDACKKIQDRLGNIHDLYNQIEWLKTLYREHPIKEFKKLLIERKKILKKIKVPN